MKKWVRCIAVLFVIAGCSLVSEIGFAGSLQMSVKLTGEITHDHRLSATAVYVVTNEGEAPVSSLTYLLYPNQFATLPAQIPEYAVQWIYPSGFSAGEMRIRSVHQRIDRQHEIELTMTTMPGDAAGEKDMLGVVSLKTPLETGQSVALKISFEVTIPKRRGRFGFFDGVTTLAGGWLPRLLPPMKTPFYRPVPMTFNGVLRIPEGYGGFALNRIFEASDESQQIEMSGSAVSEATLVLMDKMEVVKRTTSQGNVFFVTNTYTGLATFGEGDATTKRNTARTKKRRTGTRAANVERIFQTVADTGAMCSEFSKALTDMYILEVPAWDRLVQVSESSMLISERALQLVPHPKALLFHEADIAKNAAMLYLRPLVEKDEEVAPFAAEILGYHFAQRYLARASKQREELAQLLKVFSFNPYIDNLLYAPQVPFKYLYTRSIEEEDWFRDELWRCENVLPRGKRIVAKMVDLLGQQGTRKLFNTYLKSNRSLVSTLDAVLKDGPRFRKQWFGAYPRISYAIVKTESTSTLNGYIHEAVVEKSGEMVVEPVTVQFTDADGAVGRKVWNGEGRSATLEWVSKAPLNAVQLDPEFRLVETAQSQGHPLRDNAVPQKMRPPLLTQLLVWGDSVTLEPFVLASFTFKRQYDISNSFHIQGAYTPRLIGGAFNYYRHFGYNRTLNSRVWYAGPQLGLYTYKDAAETEKNIPEENRYTATMASLYMTAGMDDRQYEFDPASGKSFQISLGYAAGRSEYDTWVQHGKGSVRLFRNVSLAVGHTLALYSGVGAVVGTPPASNLTTLSHRQILRGFDLGETYGKLGVYGVVEYRHTLIGAASVAFPLRTLLQRVQGVLFTGVGSASEPQNYHSIFHSNHNYVEVGYGLRFHLLALGVVPYLLALDFAVPVYPTTREYTQPDSAGVPQTYPRAPFRFVFGITQTY
ncbi:MAG: hypothetical protein JXX29_15030 [Deltaproteobacteria bacterium]|nr:hypothetical protein [Deltaproteobacteria bacterium]MBN2672994.1 hypothetical protein [Deltaproteobacteria bacterium]